jgi:hypothetical protein
MKKLVRKVSLASFLVILTLLITSFILPCVPAQAITFTATTPQCWAVIVGVEHWKNFTGSWPWSAKDAEDFSQALSSTWGSSHIRLLTDAQATKSTILSAISWMQGQAGPNDTVLFYFSGDGTTYLYPYDSISPNHTNDISGPELGDAFSSFQAKNMVFILECWQSSNFLNALSGNGRVLMWAGDSTSSLWYSNTFQHNCFSYYVIQALNNFDDADANHNFELSAEEIFNYASPLTTNQHSNQHPIMSDGYSGELPIIEKFTFDTNISLPSTSTILTLDGTNYTSPPMPQYWAPGSSHTVSVPEIVAGTSGTRYMFTGWDDGATSTSRTITQGGSYIANYEKQYELHVESAYGNPQGAGWYEDGSTAPFSVEDYIETADTKCYLTGWSGDYTGTSASSSIVMNGPKNVTANWRIEYLLNIVSPYGSPTGGGWYAETTTANFAVTDYVETTNTKYYLTGWSGDFSGAGVSGSISMTGPKTVTANWRFEYLLTINSEYGAPTGAGWYKEGETANVYVEPTQGFLIRHLFTGWSGDLNDIQPSASISMYAPKVITANWQADYIQLIIVIVVVVVLGVGITVTVVLVRGRGGKTPPPRYNPPPTYNPPPQPPTYNAPPPPPPPPPAR